MPLITLAEGPRVARQIQHFHDIFASEQFALSNPEFPGVLTAELIKFGQRLPESHKADVFSGDPQDNTVEMLASEYIVFLHDPLTHPASLAFWKFSMQCNW